MRRLVRSALHCSTLLLAVTAGARAEPYAGAASRDAATADTEAWAEVTGWVVDAQGSTVPGARVVRLGPEGGETLTDEWGAFRLVLRHDGAPVSLVVEKQTGSETLHAVERIAQLRDGEPAELGVITLAGICEPQWTPGLAPALPGVSGSIFALAVFDDGGGPALYAGGTFLTAGDVGANRIAKWDGSSWSALGTGMNSPVYSLTVFDDGGGPALYAGGLFTTAGGVSANFIARWDGSSWSALGTGMNDLVRALTVFDDGGGPALYAGGLFTTAGGANAAYIAKWDGSSWTALGTGMNDWVYALTVFDDGGGPALYAGGFFIIAGGVSANHIARWNGSSWSALGTGMNLLVQALTVFDDGNGPGLYAGGSFSTAGGLIVNRIAKWNGSSWSALGTGLNNSVNALAVFDDGSGSGPALYASGDLTTAGAIFANRIAKWDGSSWSALGTGMNGTVFALTVFDNGSGSGPALYAGGFFTHAGDVFVNRIANWDGSSWSALGTGAFNSVSALAVFDDGSGSGAALYAGGDFTTATGTTGNFIARWNGSSWSALGTGMNDDVYSLTVFDDGSGSGPALYAGGFFTTAGGVAASGIAKWDGTSWSALGSGIDGGVNALTVLDAGGGSDSALYAGGFFTTAGGVFASNVARWDGSSWSALGTGTNSTVLDLTVFDDGSGSGPALFAGGLFTTAGGVAANRIAKWDGSSWSTLGAGLNNWVFALTVFDDGSGSGPALYAGGQFTTPGAATGRIAKWDGSAWSTLGTGMNSTVVALAVFDDGSGTGPALYAGGDFISAGGAAANRIAKWDGSSWSSLGTGMDSAVFTLAVFDDGSAQSLYAGGEFTIAGGVASASVARWQGCTFTSTPCPGDANGDNVVDFSDITTILANWLADYTPASGPGDANGDSVVDFNDITAVLSNWLSSCP